MSQEYYYGLLYTEHPRPFNKEGILHLYKSLGECKRASRGKRSRMFGQVLIRDLAILEEKYQISIID